MAEVIIRRAEPRDVEAISLMWRDLVAHHQTLDVDLPSAMPRGAERYARRLEDQLDSPSMRALVAEVDDHLAGYVLGVIVDLAPEMFVQEKSGFLADIYVQPGDRHHGVGRALVNELADWFSAHGIRYFEWHAAAHNEDALRFWERLGGRAVMVRMRADLTDDAREPEGE